MSDALFTAMIFVIVAVFVVLFSYLQFGGDKARIRKSVEGRAGGPSYLQAVRWWPVPV
jgi:hypothetical protein